MQDPSSPTRDWTHAPGSRSTESQPRYRQGSPSKFSFGISCSKTALFISYIHNINLPYFLSTYRKTDLANISGANINININVQSSSIFGKWFMVNIWYFRLTLCKLTVRGCLSESYLTLKSLLPLALWNLLKILLISTLRILTQNFQSITFRITRVTFIFRYLGVFAPTLDKWFPKAVFYSFRHFLDLSFQLVSTK